MGKGGDYIVRIGIHTYARRNRGFRAAAVPAPWGAGTADGV